MVLYPMARLIQESGAIRPLRRQADTEYYFLDTKEW